MSEKKKETPQMSAADKVLHRYARQFYLQHYRVPRFGATQGDYALQAALSLVAGIYAATQTCARMQLKDELGTLFAAALTLFLGFSTLHGLGKWMELRMDAKAFADEAILVAKSQDEVEQFFDNAYPHIFYHK